MVQLRVLMLNYEYPPTGGGTGVACEEILHAFAENASSVAVDLITSIPGRRQERQRLSDHIEIHKLPVAKRDLQLWRASELASWTRQAYIYARQLIRARQYDLCHCWGGWPAGVIGYAIRRRMPYIVGLRGSDVPGYSRRLQVLDAVLLRHVVRRVWSSAAAVLAVSDNLRQLALNVQPDATIGVLSNGIDLERFHPAERPGKRDLLFVGRLVERKGVEHLIEAFRGIAPQHPDVRLTIVGDGPERTRLEALAKQSGVSGRLHFCGQVSRQRIAAIYRQAGIKVVPSLNEAMANAVLEAMASGLAIVTTHTGIAELICDNGIIVTKGDALSIRRALQRYLVDPDLLARHQQNSRAVAETMPWRSIAESYLAIYRNVSKALDVPQIVTPGEASIWPAKAAVSRHSAVGSRSRF